MLSEREDHCDRDGWRQFFPECADPRDAHIAANRYVDDLCMMSFTLCRGCVTRFIDFVYVGCCAFDVEEAHERQLYDATLNKFLDMVLRLTFNDVSFSMFNPNHKFFMDGANGPLPKHRFPPPVGRTTDI